MMIPNLPINNYNRVGLCEGFEPQLYPYLIPLPPYKLHSTQLLIKP